MMEFIPWETWQSLPLETRRQLIEDRKAEGEVTPELANLIEQFEREDALYVKPQPEGVRLEGWQI